METTSNTRRRPRQGTFPAIGSPAGNRLDAVVTALMSGPGGLLMLAVAPLVPHHRLMAAMGIAALLICVWAWCTPSRAPMLLRHAYTTVSVVVTVAATAAAELSTGLRLGVAVLLCPVLVVACLRRPRHAVAQLGWGLAIYAGYQFATLPAGTAIVGVLATGLSLTMVSTMAMIMRGSLDRMVEGLRYQAERDPLTGLLNRQGLRRALQEAECAGATGALIMMDLDHFKRVNDQHGHQAGDDTLVWFAALLSRSLQPGDRCARFGGEEFIVVRSRASAGEAAGWADAVRAVAEEESRARLAAITVSAGVAEGSLSDIPLALERADRALYRAKAGGRNRVETATGADHPGPGRDRSTRLHGTVAG